MIYNYFQYNKNQNKILKSLLQNNNPDVTDLKLKKKISKLNEYQHFSLFYNVFVENSFHPFVKEGFSHFTKTLNKKHNKIDQYFPRSNFNTSDSQKDYFLVMNCKKDLYGLVYYFLNTSEYPKQTLITKLIVLKDNILTFFIQPLAIIIPTYELRLENSEKLFKENNIYIRDLIDELKDIEEKYQNYINEIDNKINLFSTAKAGNYLISAKDDTLKKLYNNLEKEDFIDIHKTSQEQFIEVLKSDWEEHKSIIHFKMDNKQLKYFIETFNENLSAKISFSAMMYAGNIVGKKGIPIKTGSIYSSNSYLPPKRHEEIKTIFSRLKLKD